MHDRDHLHREIEDLRAQVASLLNRPPATLPGIQILVGKAPATIPKGQTGKFNVYRGPVKGQETYTPGDDRFVYARNGDVVQGKWCYIFHRDGNSPPVSMSSSSSTSTPATRGGWEPFSPEC